MYINPLTGECEEESILNTPDKIFWFNVLANAIYAFMNGCEDAERWIFAEDQRWEHSFDELWITFYDIDPKEVRNALSKRRNYGSEKKPVHQRRYSIEGLTRRQRAKPGNHRPNRNRSSGATYVRGIEKWIESLLFGGNGKGCIEKHGREHV